MRGNLPAKRPVRAIDEVRRELPMRHVVSPPEIPYQDVPTSQLKDILSGAPKGSSIKDLIRSPTMYSKAIRALVARGVSEEELNKIIGRVEYPPLKTNVEKLVAQWVGSASKAFKDLDQKTLSELGKQAMAVFTMFEFDDSNGNPIYLTPSSDLVDYSINQIEVDKKKGEKPMIQASSDNHSYDIIIKDRVYKQGVSRYYLLGVALWSIYVSVGKDLDKIPSDTWQAIIYRGLMGDVAGMPFGLFDLLGR